jgi:hypothetical protein
MYDPSHNKWRQSPWRYTQSMSILTRTFYDPVVIRVQEGTSCICDRGLTPRLNTWARKPSQKRTIYISIITLEWPIISQCMNQKRLIDRPRCLGRLGSSQPCTSELHPRLWHRSAAGMADKGLVRLAFQPILSHLNCQWLCVCCSHKRRNPALWARSDVTPYISANGRCNVVFQVCG